MRTTEQVLTDRFGTCIDLAVLYAACLEAAGLFPVIFITRGHAFGGYYTQEIHGEATLVTEANSVANLVELGTLAPVELTGLNPGSSLDFRQAKASATRILATPSPQFAALVDVRRARLEGIRPMPHFHAASDPVEDQQLVNAERPSSVRASTAMPSTSTRPRTFAASSKRRTTPRHDCGAGSGSCWTSACATRS